MNDRPDSHQDPAQIGLCASCLHADVVVSDRGSQFWRCERSRTDPSFPKFPRLPVLTCRGYEEKRD
jgi:hypothetical protein